MKIDRVAEAGASKEAGKISLELLYQSPTGRHLRVKETDVRCIVTAFQRNSDGDLNFDVSEGGKPEDRMVLYVGIIATIIQNHGLLTFRKILADAISNLSDLE